MLSKFSLTATAAAIVWLAGCGSTATTVDTSTINTPQKAAILSATPPAALSTPVPVVRSRPIPGAGRKDPFVALFGPPSAGSPSDATANAAKNPAMVAVSTFPNIPTLPGFEPAAGGPAGAKAGLPAPAHTIWDGVRLSGVVQDDGFTAIVEAAGRSFIVHPGDLVANTFRVLSIGHSSITLATAKEERHFTLGG
ncbi:MAG: hypothetical protein M3T49_01720 [Candidatus Eremiobacteraeota bacterium]|nr:hypothetical protein [Candidatus Eremiobacteraeota bacterium]